MASTAKPGGWDNSKIMMKGQKNHLKPSEKVLVLLEKKDAERLLESE
jgi:hypothetical protein